MKYILPILYFLLCLISFLGFIAPFTPVKALPLVQFLPITWWICLILHTLSLPFFFSKTRYKWMILPFLGILMALWIGHKEVRFSEEKVEIPKNSIKVLSWNIENFKFDKDLIEEVVAFIQKEKPDIVCFQEFRLDLIQTKDGRRFTHDKEEFIAKALDLPYYSFTALRTHIVGTAYFSRFPLVKMDTCFIDERETNSGILMTFQTPQGKLGVANLHLKSYNVGSAIKKSKTWKEKFGAFVARSAEVLTIQEILAEKSNRKFQQYSEPLLVVGDMNSVPHSRSIHLISKGLQDGFLEKGNGWHTTFPIIKKWGLRIDYQFHNDKMKLCSYKVLPTKTGFSDHLPILAVYAFP